MRKADWLYLLFCLFKHLLVLLLSSATSFRWVVVLTTWLFLMLGKDCSF